MRVVAVFHGDKQDTQPIMRSEIRANPPMTALGMQHIFTKLLPKVRDLGPYHGPIYCSRMARALDTASVLALALDMDIESLKSAGQMGSKDAGGVVYYPGHEADKNVYDWRDQFELSLQRIGIYRDYIGPALMVSHRPMIGSLIAHLQGINDDEGIRSVVNDPRIVEDGYVVFDVSQVGTIKLVG